MTLLYARVDVVEGALAGELVGAPSGIEKRTFVLLTLTDDDEHAGVGEASPLPGYSPDDLDAVVESLQALVDAPIEVNALLPARALLDQTPEVQLSPTPAARFAVETAILDWLGQTQGIPAHRLLSSGATHSVDIATLVFEADPRGWPLAARRAVTRGARCLKFKIGETIEAEIDALRLVRDEHPRVRIRLDANRRLALDALERHRDALEALSLEFVEEPVPEIALTRAGSLGLPLALDETLRDEAPSRAMLPNPNVSALVIKPTVVGGITAALDLAKLARAHGAEPVLSHVFEGPIARAACAEAALAVGATEPQGLGPHPCLGLWPTHQIAAIDGVTIRSHRQPGLGLRFEEPANA